MKLSSLLVYMYNSSIDYLLQQAIYSLIGFVIYLIGYCLVIDVIERLIKQIDQFREEWFRLNDKHNSADAVPIDDLVKKEYRKRLASAKVKRSPSSVKQR